MEKCAADSLAFAENNLVQLQMEYVDLLLVHYPPTGGCGADNCVKIKEQWQALQSFAERNKTRALGVSNFCISCFKCLDEIKDVATPVINQIKFHIGMGADPDGLLSYCKSKGIVTEAYSPLGGNSTEHITSPVVDGIAASHNKTSVQVALRWIWQHGVTLTTKSGNPTHLSQDLDIFNWSLTAAEMTKLDAITSPAGKPSFACTS